MEFSQQKTPDDTFAFLNDIDFDPYIFREDSPSFTGLLSSQVPPPVYQSLESPPESVTASEEKKKLETGKLEKKKKPSLPDKRKTGGKSTGKTRRQTFGRKYWKYVSLFFKRCGFGYHRRFFSLFFSISSPSPLVIRP